MAWTNNVLSSFVLSYYHDIPPRNIFKALEALYHVKYTPDKATAEEKALIKEFEKSGAMFGTLSFGEEIRSLMAEQIDMVSDTENNKQGHFGMAHAMSAPVISALRKLKTGGLRLDEVLSDIYANQDNVFRLAAYMTFVQNKMYAKGGAKPTVAELEEAARAAAEVMVNYDINARWVNIARQTVLPFLAWPYRVMPMMAKLAVEKPWKLLNTLAVVGILDAMVYSLLGGADDREDKERGVLPEYMQGGVWGLKGPSSFVRMPFGDANSGVFFGLNRIIPLGDLAQINDGAILPQTAAPTGPLVLALNALMNWDAFKQQQIRDEAKTYGENMSASIAYLLRGTAPAQATRFYDWWDKVINDKLGPLGAAANDYVETARFLGFNFREVNFPEAAYNQHKADKAFQQRIKANARKAIRQELRYGTPDVDAMRQHTEDMNSLLMQLMEDRGYAVE
jgi:hypothetical protein